MNAGKGKRALAAELRNKGVDNDVITAALADIDAGAERERAEQLVRDKLRRESLNDDDDAKVMRRLVGMLARRGYSQSMALDVVTRRVGKRAGTAAGLGLAARSRGLDVSARRPLLLDGLGCQRRRGPTRPTQPAFQPHSERRQARS